MTIYIIKETLHFANGKTSEWMNICAERKREKAKNLIKELEENNKRYESTYHVEYEIDEIQLF